MATVLACLERKGLRKRDRQSGLVNLIPPRGFNFCDKLNRLALDRVGLTKAPVWESNSYGREMGR